MTFENTARTDANKVGARELSNSTAKQAVHRSRIGSLRFCNPFDHDLSQSDVGPARSDVLVATDAIRHQQIDGL